MTYQTLLEDTLFALPEFKKEYVKNIEADIIDADSGMHIVFGYVFVPLLENAINNNREQLITELFEYLEKMSNCTDLDVQTVCDQSVLEVICSDYPDKIIAPYMGKSTLEGLRAVRQYIAEP